VCEYQESDASGEDEEGEHDECDDDNNTGHIDKLYQFDTFWSTF